MKAFEDCKKIEKLSVESDYLCEFLEFRFGVGASLRALLQVFTSRI